MNEIFDEFKIVFDRSVDNVNLSVIKVYAPTKGIIKATITLIDKLLAFDNDSAKKSWEYKQGFSDGKEHLFNKETQTISIGLCTRLYKQLRHELPNVKIEFSKAIWGVYSNPNGKLTNDEIITYCNKLNLRNVEEDYDITPFDHQIKIIERAINGRLISLMACTSAGKSLSQYVISRYLVEVEKKKVLIIVPSSGLVEQMYRDFNIEYGWAEAETNITLIHGTSRDKLTKKKKAMLAELGLGEEVVLRNIVISTWQSLLNKDSNFFKVFTAVLVDEAHGAKATELKNIIESCVNSDIKVGLSGTIPDNGLDAALIEGSLGRREVIIRTHELIAKGLLTKTEIHSLILPYDMSVRKFIGRQDYKTECSLINNNGSRKEILDILFKSKQITDTQNTLILFKQKNNIDTMKEYLDEYYPQYKILVIKGEVPAKTRDSYRQIVNSGTGYIILATYGTMKQGVNIKYLHNLIFAEFSKSMYVVVQSIGRIVRFHKLKKLARVFDIVDDASYVTKSRGGGIGNFNENYAMKHYNERKVYYADDKFPITEIILPFNGTVYPESLDRKQKEATKVASKSNKKRDVIDGKGAKSKFLT